MRLKIDLHVHSSCSDGLGAPEDVLERAEARGLDGLAITDHNTLEGYFRAREVGSGLILVARAPYNIRENLVVGDIKIVYVCALDMLLHVRAQRVFFWPIASAFESFL